MTRSKLIIIIIGSLTAASLLLFTTGLYQRLITPPKPSIPTLNMQCTVTDPATVVGTNVYISCRGGVAVINQLNQTVESIPYPEVGIQAAAIAYINGAIYISGLTLQNQSGLFRYDLAAKQFSYLDIPDAKDIRGLKTNSDALFIQSLKGVYFLDFTKNQAYLIPYQDPGQHQADLWVDPQGFYLSGTNVAHYDLKANAWTTAATVSASLNQPIDLSSYAELLSAIR